MFRKFANFANLGIFCSIYASLLEGLAPPMVQAPWASPQEAS